MEKKMFLDFYNTSIANGRMRFAGLCGNFDGFFCDNGIEMLELFEPTDDDFNNLTSEGYIVSFWGSGLHRNHSFDAVQYGFTPLRQTIVLFMAAMNNEL